MSADEHRKRFARRAQFDCDAAVGARWWNDSVLAAVGLRMDGASRRQLMTMFAVGGGLALLTGGVLCAELVGDDSDGGGSDDGPTSAMEALALQRTVGWNAGATDQPLQFPGALEYDVNGTGDWRARIEGLSHALAPVEPRLAAYYVSTLFAATADPDSADLRAALRPINSPEMAGAYKRGEALAALLAAREAPADVAVVSDLPGPLSIAFAAGLAGRLAPVFAVDNWPHPRGVVPAHWTMAAALYYLPAFERANASRPRPAPPVFVLDAERLRPYVDDADKFDNRHLARLPDAGGLRGLGIGRILYVRPDAESLVESDDLNDEFVALEKAGIEVRPLPLTDFNPRTIAETEQAYHYGGATGAHAHFWWSYGWYRPVRPLRPLHNTWPVSRAPAHRPVPRPTIFSGRTLGGIGGVGTQKPTGFGMVSVRRSPTGGLTPVRPGRSGSFGRSRSSSFG